MSCGGGSGWLGQHRFMWAEAPSVLGQTEKRVDRKEREEERWVGWAGLGREESFIFFIFLTQTSFEQKIYFDFKLNLNFGCYKA